MKRSNNLKYNYGSRVDIYIVYELGASSSSNSDPTLKNCLFGAVTLTKNADIEKYGYSGYGIGFNRRGSFSAHIDNKKKNILVLGIGPTQGLEHTLTAEKMYSINFTVTNTKFCLSLHYNGADSYFLLMVQKFTNLKQKIQRF